MRVSSGWSRVLPGSPSDTLPGIRCSLAQSSRGTRRPLSCWRPAPTVRFSIEPRIGLLARLLLGDEPRPSPSPCATHRGVRICKNGTVGAFIVSMRSILVRSARASFFRTVHRMCVLIFRGNLNCTHVSRKFRNWSNFCCLTIVPWHNVTAGSRSAQAGNCVLTTVVLMLAARCLS